MGYVLVKIGDDDNPERGDSNEGLLLRFSAQNPTLKVTAG
jgi:hypothetical protein